MIILKGRNIVKVAGSNPSDPSLVRTIEITFDGVPSNVTATVAQNKYNIPFTLMYHVDDGISQGVTNAHSIWNANNYSYPDGCGNRIPYAADLAVNIDHATPERKPFFEWLIANRGSVLNHSAFANEEARVMQLQLIRQQYLEYLDYWVTGVVVPGADMGYGDAAITHNDLFVTSARGDVYDSMNSRMWYREVPTVPGAAPFPVNRDFTDFDDDGLITFFISVINNLITSNTSGRKYFIIGSHADLVQQDRKNRFTQIFSHLHTNYSEVSRVCSMREWAEYILMKSAAITHQLVGNKLTIKVDETLVQNIDNVSWRDLSFNISSPGAQIQSVSHSGYDSVQFNETTGLINANRRKTIWA